MDTSFAMPLSRPETGPALSARGMHVLAGSWGLPFALILAFRGAFFGFATSLGVPVMALAVFGGDQQALIETLIGLPAALDLTQAPLASLDYILADARRRTGGEAVSIVISHYDSVDAQVRVFMGPAPGALSGTVLEFAGVSRAFEGVQPIFGTAPSAGASVFALIPALHFGDFAGLASKLVWMAMGLAMAFVAASGMLLWTRRRAEDPTWQSFQHWIVVTIWGLPLAMLISAVAFFLTLPMGDPTWWTPAGFLAGVAVALGLGAARHGAVLRLRLANAVLCLGLPVLRHLSGGTSWSEALLAGAWSILLVDLLLLGLGLTLLRQHRLHRHRKNRLSTRADGPALAAREPAE
ncbi:MAG: PepSY-associated TM helix domain-containing protein [Pseudomonadota bacterium]